MCNVMNVMCNVCTVYTVCICVITVMIACSSSDISRHVIISFPVCVFSFRISNITMETAVEAESGEGLPGKGGVARFIESCICPPGYTGLSCQVRLITAPHLPVSLFDLFLSLTCLSDLSFCRSVRQVFSVSRCLSFRLRVRNRSLFVHVFDVAAATTVKAVTWRLASVR